jgi:tetratricopeptide (TPR) repeat protein
VTDSDLPDGTPSPSEGSGTIREGARFGDLTLVRELGRGSQGIVYEAHQESLNRTVAVKILPKDVSFTDDQTERFRREAEAAGRLAHGNIVAVYGLTESHGHLLISQEMVTGGSLEDAVEERTKDGHSTTMDDCAWAAGICKQLAEGLRHAHEHGIVHRDIKPANALLTENGRPKITDFGLAKVEDKLGLSKTGALMGTPHYMSPEQVQAVKDTVGAPSDIYSLGAMLYKMLTGSVPHSGDSLQKVFLDILTRAPPSPRKLQPGVSPDLEAVCLKALEKDPEDRYESAKEFAADLDRYLAGQPTLARPVGPIGRAARSLKRLATSTLAAVVLLVPTLWVAIDALQLRRMAERNADVHFWRLGFVGLCTLLVAWPLVLLGIRLTQGKRFATVPSWALALVLGGTAGWVVLEQRTTQLHMAARAELSDHLEFEIRGSVRTVDDLHAYVGDWQDRFDAEDYRLVARGFLKRERPTIAEDWALRAEAGAPDDPVTHAILLATFHALGRDGEADQAELSMNTLAKEKKDWKAWQQVGDILRDMRRFESAATAYVEAQRRPDVNRDQMNLKQAQIAVDLCDWGEAQEKLKRFIEYKEDDLAANVVSLDIAVKETNWPRAEKALTLIESAGDVSTDLRLGSRYTLERARGMSREIHERIEAAIEDASTPQDEREWSVGMAMNIGLSSKQGGNPEMATAFFELAESGYETLLEEDQDSLLGHLGLAATNTQLAPDETGYARMARLDAAIEHAEAAVGLDPQYDEGHLNLGLATLSRAWEEAGVYELPLSRYAEKLAAVSEQDIQTYVDHVANALDCNGLNPDTLNDTAWVLGQLYERTGERDTLELALQYSERAVKLKQADRAGGKCGTGTNDLRVLGMAHDTRAELHEKAGDYEAALVSEEAALESEPDKAGQYAQYYRTRIDAIQAKIDG